MKNKKKEEKKKPCCFLWMTQLGIDVSNYDFSSIEPLAELKFSSLKQRAREIKETLNYQFTVNHY